MDKPKIDPITIQVTPSLELLGDVVTTAVEGGIGYWSQMEEYLWEGLEFPVAKLIDIAEPDPKGEAKEITPEVVRRGMQLALTPGICLPEGNTFTSVYRALTEDDGGAIDADAADNVIQLGLYGVIRYA